MDILLAFIFGGVMGLIVQYALPQRGLRGIILLPAIGAVVGGAVWLAMTWSGVTTENPWIWLLSAIVPAVVVLVTGVVLTRVRAAGDLRERTRLGLL